MLSKNPHSLTSTQNIAAQEKEAQGLFLAGKKALLVEAESISSCADRLDSNFTTACKLILGCSSKLVFTGLGKSGHIAAKLASTFSSTGTPSFFLHPSEAQHGDYGMISPGDVLCAIAYSGSTPEVCKVANFARLRKLPVISITGGGPNCRLALESTVVLDGRVTREADPLGLAPTSSSSVALALGDALAAALIQARGFSKDSFGELHPGGSLGQKLKRAGEFLIPQSELKPASQTSSFQHVLSLMSEKNYGIIPVVDTQNTLLGCITDGDIRRTILKNREHALKLCAGEIMHKKPYTTGHSTRAGDCIELMQNAKITSLFILDSSNKLDGMVRLQDMI